jgi:predicted dehydrogenase
MTDLKFAVFGAGWWAGYQIPAWFEVGGVELAALCDRNLSKAENMAKKHNVPRVYSDPEELFHNEQLDFVDLIADNDSHASLVKLAAKYRVPVICQKPMATDWEICLQMVRVCKDAGVPFIVHENLRWQAPVREVRRLLDEGHIGEPYRAHINVIGYSPMEYVDQPFLKELDKLALMDLGSHVLDTSRFLFGEAQTLYCQTRRSRDDIKGEDVATVVMQMGSVICVTEMSNATRTPWNHFPDVYIFIEGTKGSIVLDWDYNLRLATDNGTVSRRVEAPYYDWLRADQWQWHASMVPCNADCLKEIKTGVLAETTAADNLKSMQLVFAAYTSAANNQVMTVEPVELQLAG